MTQTINPIKAVNPHKCKECKACCTYLYDTQCYLKCEFTNTKKKGWFKRFIKKDK